MSEYSEYKEEREIAREKLNTITYWIGESIDVIAGRFENGLADNSDLDELARLSKAYVPAQLALLNILKEEEEEAQKEYERLKFNYEEEIK